MPDFVHLHVHTHYSTLDGACRFPDLIEKAKASGMPGIAITDHGNLFGAIGFYGALKAAGLKPIIGYEAYVAPGSRFEKAGGPSESNSHLTLLCQNRAGYLNLMKLASSAYLEGFHYKPRIDRELLAEHSDGLIVLSGCLKGEAASAASMGDTARAREVLAWYRDLLGPERFYVEIQENGLEEQARANSGLVELALELGLKLVATNDVHYLDREDAPAHDVLLCIGTGKRRNDEQRLRFRTDAFYFRTAEEMAGLFSEIPESLASTIEIAEKCELELEFGEYRYPKFDVPEGETEPSYLRKLVEEGARERYGAASVEAGPVRERIDSELGIIERMGFPGYMLIVGDIVRFARERGIPVGPGRGSATGSVVSYALGITKLDPFKYDLIFERFMNEGRNEMPDIDLDFCQSRREEVIEYVTGKYGRDRVAQIITFGTMAARASIRDVGRVLDVPLPVVDRVARLVPGVPGMTLEKALELEPEIARRAEDEPAVGEILDIARRLEGLTRQPGKHAAGVVIADRPLTDYCPLYRQPGTDETMTQFDMNAVTEIGLLKVDFLGLQTLTMLKLAAQLVEERTGKQVDPDEIPLDDAKTYQLFQRAATKGVFQFESGGMRDLLRGTRPDRLADLIALNAMYRPGPMDDIPAFTRRKHGREEAPKVAPAIDRILEETYGTITYQEQVMRIAQTMAGFSLSDADKLRKAMGKKKAKLMARFREQFMAGAAERGYDASTSTDIYDRMEKFSGYGFNKSHSAAYALIAYQTAYFKANHPTEFMAALLTLDMGKTEKVAEYAEEARRMGIEILPPSVDESGIGFTITGEKQIRFGLAAVKGVGEKAVESIITARKERGAFKSLLDFCERVDLRLVNKSVIQSLVKAGAFDGLGAGRARVFEGVARAIDSGSRAQADRASGQGSLFDALGPPPTGDAEGARGAVEPDEGLPDVPEWPEKVRLANEKAVVGLYVSGHPLSAQTRWLDAFSATNTVDIVDFPDGTRTVIGGLLASVQFRIARSSGNKWALVILEDLHGTLECRVFSRTLDRSAEKLVPDSVVFLAGRIDSSGGRVSFLVDDVIPFSEAPARFLGGVTIRVSRDDLDDGTLDELAAVVERHPGLAEVQFEIDFPNGATVVVRAGEGVRTGPGPDLDRDLKDLVGTGCLVLHPRAERLHVPEAAAGRNRRWEHHRRT
jgi:DNA polymerase-3 subunit alpha